MKMVHIIRRLFVRSVEKPAPADAQLQGLNLGEAFAAHKKWVDRLTAALKGESEETLDPAVIACDDRCVLGQWIYGSEYGYLRRVHAEFHKDCAHVVTNIEQGDEQSAREGIKKVSRKSSYVVMALSALFGRVEKARRAA